MFNILIADDEKDIRNLLKITFAENNYNVFCAENGKDAISIVEKEKIDLIILDVMMPILDGFNFLHKIRERKILTPVIFLTAKDSEMDKILGLGLGADDYLSKPFSTNELLARTKAVLRRSKTYNDNVNNDILEYYGLKINQNTCCVYLDNELIELGAKEYNLLLFFIKNPEVIFTKKQLYKAIWSDDIYYDDNTIMVHISRVRSKIETNSQKPKYLKTIRGLGYKLHYTEEK